MDYSEIIIALQVEVKYLKIAVKNLNDRIFELSIAAEIKAQKNNSYGSTSLRRY